MALEKQIQIYGIDTRNFYSNNEERIHALNQKVRYERKNLIDKIKVIESRLIEDYNFSDEDIKTLRKDKYNYEGDDKVVIDLIEEYNQMKELIAHKAKIAKKTKEKILQLFENKFHANYNSNGKHHIRELANCFEEHKKDYVISVFDSSFTRMIGAKPDTLSEDFMVVQIYYFDVAKDLIYYGFTYKGEKYIYFTSSAGQIRTKKCVFIKESVYKKYEKTMMCGLTLDSINAKGGNNPNKHLAYLALCSSSTDVWEEFDIDKTIVIDDFETNVFGTYDYIDIDDYSIERKNGNVPITHTDGAGMMLPCMGKNRQIRLPWIKGLVGQFDFVKFIKEHNCLPIIKDIYGKEHDVIAEDIQIILTKSQFKMWKYYDSWEQYKAFYKEYGCSAAYANIEEDKKRNATINYQMLQSLTDITDKEVKAIAEQSVNQIKNICSSVDAVKTALGVSPYNELGGFQKAINLYPNLLNDCFITSKLRDIKNSWINNARAGKLRIKGKYSFLLPDFYAACEYWFCHNENPDGLLADGEVFDWLAKKHKKVDCLRSPHLYKEHAIRTNKACNEFEDSQRLREWFTTDAVYTSCHDLISKLLMFDCDGDISLVVTDKTLVDVAERNMKGIVPLYYDMKKASPSILNNETIWQGLNASFTGGNIGSYSNNISKIWNSDVFLTGTDEEKEEALKVIKLLCAENNFVIDAAKTLFIPERPSEIDTIIKRYTKCKLPAFFRYAKDKENEQVDLPNDSFVNQLSKIIPDTRISLKKLGLEKPDYTLLMQNPKIECKYKVDKGKLVEEETDPLILEYHKLMSELSLKYVSISQFETDKRNESSHKAYVNHQYSDLIKTIRERLLCFGYSESEVVDILIKYLYKRNMIHKGMFWLAYEDILYSNLEKNIKEKSKLHSPKKLTLLEKIAMLPPKQEQEYYSDMEKVDKLMKQYKREQNRINKNKCLKEEKSAKCSCCGGDTFTSIYYKSETKTDCPKCIADSIIKMWNEKIEKVVAKKSISANTKTKEVQCVDCGEWFFINKKNTATCRCDECAKKHKKEMKRLENQRYLERKKLKEKLGGINA